MDVLFNLAKKRKKGVEQAGGPVCGFKTIPDHEELEFEDNLCDECYAKANSESKSE